MVQRSEREKIWARIAELFGSSRKPHASAVFSRRTVANVIQNRVPMATLFAIAGNRTKKFAGVLLLIFLAQCVWLIHAELRSGFGCYPSGTMERQSRAREGLAQWRGQGVAGTPENGPPLDTSPIGNSSVPSFHGYDP